MIENLLASSLIAALWFVGYQLYKVVRIMEAKHLPTGRNEEAVEVYENEPEPRQGR